MQAVRSFVDTTNGWCQAVSSLQILLLGQGEEGEGMSEEIKLSFQQYEIDLILLGLDKLIDYEHSHCKWEEQKNGCYSYTPNRRIRQIRFIERSIKRQLVVVANEPENAPTSSYVQILKRQAVEITWQIFLKLVRPVGFEPTTKNIKWWFY